MKLDDRVDVGVIGATVTVGQSLIQLLENHAWFRLSEVCGSSASVGKTLAERLGAGADGLSSATAGLRLQAPDGPWTSSILLSALPSEPASRGGSSEGEAQRGPKKGLLAFSSPTVVAGP